MNPDVAAVAGGKIRIGHAFGGVDRQRPRQSLAELRRAHGGERTDLAFAAAFEKARKAAYSRERAHQRTAADTAGAARGEESAHIAGRQCREFRQ